jgi:Fe-S-cluster containining protein
MALPLKPLPTVERWDCHQCGICCRGSIVPLSDEDLARLKAQKWEEMPDLAGTPVIQRDSWLGRDYRLAHRPDGSCVFLLPDGLCRIHKELGFDAKPLVCRMFPLQVVPRDGVAILTIRRACPSAAADKGRPVAEQLDFAKKLARERGLTDQQVQPPPLKPGDSRGWPATRRLLDTLHRVLSDERYPPVRRLVHALILCRLLERAKTGPLDDAKLGDLLKVLESSVADEVGDLFSQRQPPSPAASVIFRQIAGEYVRLHPRYHVQPSWTQRLKLAWAAWKLVRGRGELPRLHPKFPVATFEQLEQPLGLLDASLYQPFVRFIETTSESWSYAVANRGGWSVIESLRQLAISYPVGLWLLRWASVGREATLADVLDIVTALDRGQGYAPLAGTQERQRLRVLAGMDELTRLVVWYGR